MSKILQELDDLVANQVITPQVASAIRDYYNRDQKQGTSRMLIAFGIIGSLLVGLGIILIIAHNWDNFPRFLKVAFGLLPLLITQAIGFRLIQKDSTSVAWREATAIAIICAVAASITIISQIYHISGDLARFLMAWMALSIPVCYLLKSSAASMAVIAGLTWYAVEDDYFSSGEMFPWFYWTGMAAMLPYYIKLCRNHISGNATAFHHWLLAISFLITFGTISNDPDIPLAFAYATLLSIFFLVGQLNVFSSVRIRANGWLVLGSLGSISMLLTFTFEELWEEVYEMSVGTDGNMFLWIATIAVGCILLYMVISSRGLQQVPSKTYIFLLIPVLFLLARQAPEIAQVLANIATLVIGILTVREGAKVDKLWQMNYGLLIIAALITCRFFDTDLSFVVRGILFVLVGSSFFVMNYWVVRKRQKQTT